MRSKLFNQFRAGARRVAVVLPFVFSTGVWGAEKVDFKKEVEPLLIKRCSECHGPDKQKSKLRLDRKADAFRGGESGAAAIVPGKGAESEIYKRIVSKESDEVMPPKGEPLSGAEADLIRRWMDEGAHWPEEKPVWSFVAPVRPKPPEVKSRRWARNDIDRFILAKLEASKLVPSPQADRPTLIRRLALDLTGLPPSLAEVDAFVKDRSPDAYEKLVDRYLSSTAAAEHITRWWLDLARYADSNGYQVDLTRSIWPYRDWVINAFERNMPFDQFTVEQLAGDLLPNASLDQKVATGFLRNSKINDEGGGDAEEYRVKAVKDRVATTATTWLGLTMMCAECHTHKYDPITQEDYYKFYAFLNNTTDGGNYSIEPTVAVPPPNLGARVGFVRRQIQEAQQALAAAERELPAAQAAWEARVAGRPSVWRTLELTNAISTGGSTFTNLLDQSILATGVNPIYDTITVEAATPLSGITAVMLEVLPDPSLPKNGPGRWGATGNFILDEFGMNALPLAGGAGQTNLAFRRATADWEQDYYRAEHAVDRNPKTGWAIGPQFGKPHFMIAELKEPIRYESGARLAFRFDHYHGSSHTIGRMRLSVTTETDPSLLWPLSESVAEILKTPAAQRSDEQRSRLTAHYRGQSPTIRGLERELIRLNQKESELATAKFTTPILQERGDIRPSYVHVRGNFLEKGPEVRAGVPASLPPIPAGQATNRLGLARWLVSKDNPLTARVTVNRFWERFFGTGLVKTSEDLGRQGEAPSHPELLDWLACEFMDQGWNVRAMLRLMVMSATYQQSTVVKPEVLQQDPYNRLLARGPRFRLDAESIRDQALVVSGLLNPEVGGPSVYPVQPANLWKEIGFLRPEIGMDEWPLSEGPELYRRAVYTFWRRVCTYPAFATFDAPSRDVCTARRPRTNTPLQALAGLNEATFFEMARGLAERVLREGGSTPAARVEYAFRLCTSRPPTSVEKKRLLQFLEQQTASFQRDPQSASTLLGGGKAVQSAGLDVRQWAAWTMVANILLNLDEVLTKG